MKTYQQNISISSGASVSGIISVLGAQNTGLLVHLPTSCTAYLQVSFDTTSANFRRVDKTDGSGDWTWNVGSGKAATMVKDVAGVFPYMRLETGVTQEDTTSLQAVSKY